MSPEQTSTSPETPAVNMPAPETALAQELVQPAVTSEPPPPPKSNKKLFVIIGAVIALLILAGVGIFAFMWVQQPIEEMTEAPSPTPTVAEEAKSGIIKYPSRDQYPELAKDIPMVSVSYASQIEKDFISDIKIPRHITVTDGSPVGLKCAQVDNIFPVRDIYHSQGEQMYVLDWSGSVYRLDSNLTKYFSSSYDDIARRQVQSYYGDEYENMIGHHLSLYCTTDNHSFIHTIVGDHGSPLRISSVLNINDGTTTDITDVFTPSCSPISVFGVTTNDIAYIGCWTTHGHFENEQRFIKLNLNNFAPEVLYECIEKLDIETDIWERSCSEL